MNNTLVSATSGSNPDIIIKHQFDLSRPSFINYMLDHNGKDKSVSDILNDHDIVSENAAKKHGQYEDYVDYSRKDYATLLEDDVSDELTTTFNQNECNLSKDELSKLKTRVKNAAREKNLMWKTVVSLSDDFLITQQIMDNKTDRNLDQRRLKEIIQKSMPDFLEAEGISNSAEWFGNIHLYGDVNDEHVHIHLATFEESSARPKIYNAVTKQIEPKGLFKQKTIDQFKSSIWRNLKLDKDKAKERDLFIQRQISSKKLLKKVDTMTYWKEQRILLNSLINILPKEKNKWRAKSNDKEMQAANQLAAKFIDKMLSQNDDELNLFNKANSELQNLYKKGYGESKGSDKYKAERKKELEQQLINRLYSSLKKLDDDEILVDVSIDPDVDKLSQHREIKEILEKQINNMTKKGLVVPKDVKKELGKQKRAIKVENTKAEIHNVNELQTRVDEYIENNIVDEQMVNDAKEYLSEKEAWLNLNLKSKYELTDIDKALKMQYALKYKDVSKVSIDDVTSEFKIIQMEKLNIQSQILHKHPELYAALNNLDIREIPHGQLTEVLMHHHENQRDVLEMKSNIHENNASLKAENIDSVDREALLQQNRILFAKLKEKNKDIEGLSVANKRQKINQRSITKFGHIRTQKFKLRTNQVKNIARSIQSINLEFNDGDERARDAYEQEQQRIKQKERER